MGFLKDFLSGSLSSQNPRQSRDAPLPQARPEKKLAAAETPSATAPVLSPAQRARAKYEEGLGLFDGKHNLQGMEAFIQATEIDPDCVDAWFALAKCFHRMDSRKFIEDIFTCAENALRAAPDNPKSRSLGVVAYTKKGEIAAEAHEWPKAYRYFRRAYQLDPDGEVLADDNSGESIDSLTVYAWSAEQAGKLADLVNELRTRLAQNPQDERVRYVLGRSLMKLSTEQPVEAENRMQMLSEAETHLTTFLSDHPLSAEANYFLGFVYVGQGRTRLAAEIATRLADIDIERSRDLREVLEG